MKKRRKNIIFKLGSQLSLIQLKEIYLSKITKIKQQQTNKSFVTKRKKSEENWYLGILFSGIAIEQIKKIKKKYFFYIKNEIKTYSKKR